MAIVTATSPSPSPTGSSSLLLGPPELIHFKFSSSASASFSSDAAADDALGDDFMKMLCSNIKEGPKLPLDGIKPPTTAMGLTENSSPTWLSSGDACLDFFFQVVPDTPPERLTQLLAAAWAQDPFTSLKLVAQLRGVRGTGKSDRDGFYAAAAWLHKHHPATLRLNVAALAFFGYLKDLPQLLLHLLQGPAVVAAKRQEKLARAARMKAAKQRPRWSKSTDVPKSTRRRLPCRSQDQDQPRLKGYWGRKGAAAREARRNGTLAPRDERVAAEMARGRQLSDQARQRRQETRLQLAARAVRRHSDDAPYRALHDDVAQHLADMLANDVAALARGDKRCLSLAAKWCPSLDSSLDRATLLCESIACRLFPRPSDEDETADADVDAEVAARRHAYRSRERLRKEVLVPLRRALELPEVAMCAGRWRDVNYQRVASVAMRTYTPLFQSHDGARFEAFLDDVRAGKTKVAAGALLPHHIVQSALKPETAEVAELQWQRMVDDLSRRGKLSDSLAVCDVSGSMCGTPLDVCLALGILVSEVSREPWKGHVITFSESPEIHVIRGSTLAEKHAFTQSMNWGMNTDFQKVFDAILGLAQLSRLAPEKMLKQLFVFSDMEFDQASSRPWETDYMAVKRKFEEAGYGSPPRIVFWNLRDSRSTPVLQEQAGVGTVSGFSKNLLKLFLDSEATIDPARVMRMAIQGAAFQRLVVVD